MIIIQLSQIMAQFHRLILSNSSSFRILSFNFGSPAKEQSFSILNFKKCVSRQITYGFYLLITYLNFNLIVL